MCKISYRPIKLFSHHLSQCNLPSTNPALCADLIFKVAQANLNSTPHPQPTAVMFTIKYTIRCSDEKIGTECVHGELPSISPSEHACGRIDTVTVVHVTTVNTAGKLCFVPVYSRGNGFKSGSNTSTITPPSKEGISDHNS
jgi:hypothetical protein